MTLTEYDIFSRDDGASKRIKNARQKALNGKAARIPSYRGSQNEAWLTKAVRAMTACKQIALSLTPNTEIVVVNNSCLYHSYVTQQELGTALMTAARGESRKSLSPTAGGALSANVFNCTAGAAAAGFAVFGWRLRVTASALNFDFRPILVDIGPVLNAAGVLSIPTPVVTLALLTRKLPIDVILVSPANAGGQATIVAGQQDEVVLAGATTASNGISVRSLGLATVFASFESLNQRDLNTRSVAGQEGGSIDQGITTGIRDEEEGGSEDPDEDAVYDILGNRV
jgi:hypothetical protein